MKVVRFTGAGGNDVVELHERPTPEPGGQEVRVRVRFAGLNPADVRQRQGLYPAPRGVVPDVPGLEVAGTVETVGPAATRWRRGDRVFGLVAGGGLSSHVIVDESCLTTVPANLSEAEASAVPEAFVTAHDALMTQGGLRMGETVLIRAGSGAVGSAAIQIAREAGATVLTTVRNKEAKAFVESLGATVLDGASPVQDTPGGVGDRGVDLVLQLVGGETITDDLDALALRGRIVVVGVPAGQDATVDLRALMHKRASVVGTVLRSRPVSERALALRSFERQVLPSMAAGRFEIKVSQVFASNRAAEAFDAVERAGRIGKVLIEFD